MGNEIVVGESTRDGDVERFAVVVDGRKFDVSVSDADARALAPGAPARDLIRESFVFLLQREPASSILRSFELRVIERYFPEYRAEIKRRLVR